MVFKQHFFSPDVFIYIHLLIKHFLYFQREGKSQPNSKLSCCGFVAFMLMRLHIINANVNPKTCSPHQGHGSPINNKNVIAYLSNNSDKSEHK